MNSLTVFGQVVSEPRYREGDERGSAKTKCIIEVQTRQVPLRFSCMGFGETAEQMRYLAVDSWCVAVGTLQGGYDLKTKAPTMTFFIKEISLLEIPQPQESISDTQA